MHEDARARTGAGAPSGDPFVGRVLEGRYRVGARIARGGMASVYEGTDLRLDRTVAIKIMHAGLGDDEAFAARFVREARAAARLSHPNVVAVYDQGHDDAGDGALFIVMELVPGHTLRDTVTKEAPMSAQRALALMEPVLSALGSAHRAGLIHRDIKPENVLIADDGRVKVADFGLAKAVSSETQHTTKGVLIGSVSYLAPELVVEGQADARADVYAVGVVLFELLTGTKPHEGETPIQVAYKHVHYDVPPPSSLAPDLPAYVDALVARATAREPSLRPADASVLLHQVHRVSHALADGVRDDPELTQDLAPLLLARGDTSPDFWDDAEMAQIVEPAPTVREHTTTYPQSLPPPPGPPEEAVPDEGPPRSRRSRRGPVLLVLALVLILAGVAGAVWFIDLRYTTTPGVLGMSQVDAEAKLQAAGLQVDYDDPAYSETVPEGSVLATDPDPGSRILDDGTVTVTLSLGKERYDVPRLKGKTEDQAQDALRDLNLSYDETILRYSEKVAEGRVIGTDPQAGTTLKPGAAVDLIVSRGRQPIRVGEWIGRDADRAISVLTDRGLEPMVTEKHSDTVPDGDVIDQDPTGGSLFKGDQVALTVSLGPELVEVPSVRGFGIEAATERLTDLGFEVETESIFPDPLGFVTGTDPSAGEQVPRGSTITLNVV